MMAPGIGVRDFNIPLLVAIPGTAHRFVACSAWHTTAGVAKFCEKWFLSTHLHGVYRKSFKEKATVMQASLSFLDTENLLALADL
jgi:hypothetical protein